MADHGVPAATVAVMSCQTCSRMPVRCVCRELEARRDARAPGELGAAAGGFDREGFGVGGAKDGGDFVGVCGREDGDAVVLVRVDVEVRQHQKTSARPAASMGCGT